jgi:hypothetical protein
MSRSDEQAGAEAERQEAELEKNLQKAFEQQEKDDKRDKRASYKELKKRGRG